MKLSILAFAVVGLLLQSCGSSSESAITVKKGEEFSLEEQKMTVDFKASTILVSEKDQQTLVAPEGKIYLLVDVKGKSSDYFLSVKDGDKEVEAVDFLISQPFVRELDLATTPDKSDLYLVDISNANLTVEVKSFGGTIATLKVGTLKDETTIKINPKMKSFLNEFTEGGRILEAAKKYVKPGVNPYDITTENGEPMFGDPITKGLSFSNITADGIYVCTAEIWYESVEVSWDGDYISKIVVKVKP